MTREGTRGGMGGLRPQGTLDEAIDLQKMNWKMRGGLAEQTGVSLKA